MQGIHAHADTCARAPKRTASSAAPAAFFYPVFVPNCGPALRRRGVCGHVTHAQCAPGIPPVRAPVNPLRHLCRRRKCLPPRSWNASSSSLRHRGDTLPCPLRSHAPTFRSVTRSNLSPAWMSTTLSRLHLRQYSDTHAAAVSGYSRMSFPDLHTGHGTNTPDSVDLHKTTALPFMENSSFPGQPSRACASREKAPCGFMLGHLRFLFKRFPPFSLPLFLKLYLIRVY